VRVSHVRADASATARYRLADGQLVALGGTSARPAEAGQEDSDA